MKFISDDMLKGYAFDIDSNLFFTDTKILLEKFDGEKWDLIEVSQEDFPELIKNSEYRFLDGDKEKSMENFRSSNTFKKDIIDALDANRFGPSWEKFKKATLNARPISLITARGHPIDEILETHKFIIFETLSESELDQLIYWMGINIGEKGSKNKLKIVKRYLDNNLYIPVRSKDFEKIAGINGDLSTWQRKLVGFEMFIGHLNKVFESYTSSSYLKDKKISVGFSDDLGENINGMRDFIENSLLKKYPNFKFSVYDTSNPEFVKKVSMERDN